MDNENLIRMRNRILFSHQAGGRPLIGTSVAAAGDPAATGDKPDVKRRALCALSSRWDFFFFNALIEAEDKIMIYSQKLESRQGER